MATHEKNVLMSRTDENGDLHLLYPVTTAECVDGLDEIESALNESIEAVAGDLVETDAKVESKAPISHSSNNAIYGAGSEASYGHVKLSDSTNSSSAADSGVAATPAAVASAYSLADTANAAAAVAQSAAETAQAQAATAKSTAESKAPISHASEGTAYGLGSGSSYGHIKLSDSTTSTNGVNDGCAATPSAVSAAYSLANSANAAAVAAQASIDSIARISDEKIKALFA